MQWSRITQQLIDLAIEEDLAARGDISAALLPGRDERIVARLVARQAGTLCGIALAPLICERFAERLQAPLHFIPTIQPSSQEIADGAALQRGDVIAALRGPRTAVLSTERTLLNFLSRLSGVASLTHRFVDEARRTNPHVQILDTRKTLPGWRELDKYAVRAGAGHNHRMGLYDAVLIKDNHLAGIPPEQLAATLTRWFAPLPPRAEALGVSPGPETSPAFIEVEVDNLAQFREVCRVPGVDVILLDNFTVDQMRAAVEERDARDLRGRVALEVSGGVRLDQVADIAATGVDRISVGALTHSAAALDMALDF